MSAILVQNTLLKQAEAKIESQLKPEVKSDYLKIVVSGMKVAMSNGLLQQLKTSKDPLSDIVKGTIGLIGMLRKESKGTMPIKAMVPAGATLMFKALDYADSAGVLKVDNNVLDQATQMYMDQLMAAMKVTPQMVQRMTQRAHSVMQDPAKMAKLHQMNGGAPTPPAAPVAGG